MTETDTLPTETPTPLAEDELRLIDAYRRAANYLPMGDAIVHCTRGLGPRGRALASPQGSRCQRDHRPCLQPGRITTPDAESGRGQNVGP